MKWDRIFASCLAGIGTAAAYLWGGVDEILILLVTLMSLDYVLGIMCAFRSKCLSSDIGFKGLLKKITILIIIAVGTTIDTTIKADGAIRSMVMLFYSGLEGISILENASLIGVPIPSKLEDALVQLRDGGKKDKEGDYDEL